MRISRFSSGQAVTIFVLLNILFKTTKAYIACYRCSSRNRTDVHCEDPMAPAFLPISKNCMVPKEHHMGNFPANYCVKMIGTSIKTGELLVIRTCVLEDMNSQCGTFRFEEDTLRGCILTCNYDGCNRATKSNFANLLTVFFMAFSLYPIFNAWIF